MTPDQILAAARSLSTTRPVRARRLARVLGIDPQEVRDALRTAQDGGLLSSSGRRWTATPTATKAKNR